MMKLTPESIHCHVPESDLLPDVAMPMLGLREKPAEGERALLLALIETAWQDYRKYREQASTNAHAALVVREVTRWLSGWHCDKGFEYAAACEHLGLDAKGLRRAILEGKP